MINRLANYIVWRLKKRQVFALVGKAGTGKSFRAQLIADKYKIELIIDDGLLIKENKIVCGKSAKKAKSPLGAIRTALFDDPEQLKEIKDALETSNFKKILIIGTSKRMVEKIARKLRLPHISRIVNIEDIASEEEIEVARKSREHEGKHIIPVPGIEVQMNYSHIFFDSIKIFFKRKFRLGQKKKIFEKSIVTPEYSKRGKLSISEAALSQMILHCIDEFDTRLKVNKIILVRQVNGYILKIIIKVPYGMELPHVVHDLQTYIIKNIEKYTGITLKEVNIIIGTIT
ncbi:MAG: hypothetical protein JW881_09440 [Spirochaetales bacterium]|nr:hypothetical protein [Spirochaetales bacterium]